MRFASSLRLDSPRPNRHLAGEMSLLALILPASQLLSGAYFVSDLMAGLGIGVLVAFIVNEAFRKRVHVDNE